MLEKLFHAYKVEIGTWGYKFLSIRYAPKVLFYMLKCECIGFETMDTVQGVCVCMVITFNVYENKYVQNIQTSINKRYTNEC